MVTSGRTIEVRERENFLAQSKVVLCMRNSRRTEESLGCDVKFDTRRVRQCVMFVLQLAE